MPVIILASACFVPIRGNPFPCRVDCDIRQIIQPTTKLCNSPQNHNYKFPNPKKDCAMIIKFGAALVLGVCCQLSFAEIHPLTWSLDPPLDTGITKFESLELDLEILPRFVRANGALVTDANQSTAIATGTCRVVQANEVFCSMAVSNKTLSLVIDAQLNGTYFYADSDSSLLLEGSVVLSGD